MRTRGAVARYSETPIQLKRAPDLGEDNYDILGKYGWDKAKVDAMEKKWSEKRK